MSKLTDKERLQSIDVFRGLSIILMVFYTLVAKLSDNLPAILRHNYYEQFLPGDFVLPMFLFASGMSLVFFDRKRMQGSLGDYVFDVSFKLLKLLAAAAIITPFSAKGFLYMDEVMLNGVLFVPLLLLLRLPDRALVGTILVIWVVYAVLFFNGIKPNPNLYYLGGYHSAAYYLPVVIGGALAARNLDRLTPFFAGALIVAAALMPIFPPLKMIASPPFMSLSIAFSIAVFILLRNVQNRHLLYLGRNPLRYWVMMFIFFVIPVEAYCVLHKATLPFQFGWVETSVFSILAAAFLYGVSKWIDSVKKDFTSAIQKRSS